MHPFFRSLSRFLREDRGAVAMIFGLAIIPIFMAAGVALDYTRASVMRSRLNNLADRAALAGVKAAAQSEADCITRNSTTGVCSLEGIKKAGEAVAAKIFASDPLASNTNVTLTKNSAAWSATVRYAGLSPAAMSKMVGVTAIPVKGSVTANISLGSHLYLNVHMLLDHSMSMGIGASADDISRMQALTGCAFGCHTAADADKYYHQPKAQGIRFRIDDLREASTALVAQVATVTAGNARNHIQMGAYAFNHTVDQLVPMTADLAQVSAAVQALDLPTTDDGTQAKDAVAWLNNVVPQSGDGLAADRPQQLVVIVTDGVEDGIYTGWQGMTAPTGLPLSWWDPNLTKANTGAFPVGSCDALKAKNVIVAVVYTTYVPFVGTEQYDKLIGPFAMNIEYNLQSCATKDYFFVASNPGDIRTGMQTLFNKALAATALKLTN